ncbi:MAG TPA: hypothetical protein VEK84_10055 [Terriglobales bacterium]|nr:hypothetical protein [Terriglobales bacterium]
MSDSDTLGKVRAHLQLYDHPLLAFSARENQGTIEVLIDLKNSNVPVHTYQFQIHPRDLDHPQFAWNLQRQLYDALHDYFIEMFTRTPQDRTISANPTSAKDGS